MNAMKPLSVSALNAQIQSLIDATFLEVVAEGEVSNLTKHNSGHTYFSIKDKDSAIRCVLFRHYSGNVKFELKNAQKIIVYGSVRVYTPRGEYQINCTRIEPSGAGALHLAFEQLKQKLMAKGYFDPARKKPLPPFPRKIALITSNTSAALQDMLRVAQSRWNLIKIVNFDTLVQGEDAKHSIAANIRLADGFFGTDEAFDAIVVGRGGGSVEDLWAFNEEMVAEAIFESRTPVVSAVGHEVDYVISDFVADLRAPTPSAAMEMILPDQRTWLLNLDNLCEDMHLKISRFFTQLQKQVQDYGFFLRQHNVENKLNASAKMLSDLRELLLGKAGNILLGKNTNLLYEQLELGLKTLLSNKASALREIDAKLKARNLDALCANGYAQIIHKDKVARLEDLREGDEIEIVTPHHHATAQIKKLVTKP